jgi:hypothetical protein
MVATAQSVASPIAETNESVIIAWRAIPMSSWPMTYSATAVPAAARNAMRSTVARLNIGLIYHVKKAIARAASVKPKSGKLGRSYAPGIDTFDRSR